MRLYRIQRLDGNGRAIRLPPSLASTAGDQVTVVIGAAAVHAAVLPGGAEEVIAVTDPVFEQVRLPLHLTMQVRTQPGRISLGPAVGIIGGRKASDLSPWRLDALANHMLGQGDQGGLFVVTDLGSIDTESRTVAGHAWTPGEGWRHGLYPLPAALYRRYGAVLSAEQRAALQDAGVSVFNERVFHKGEAAQWMAEEPELRPHLPETEPLAGAQTVLAMLERHETVFVKPVWGSLAEGILRVQRRDAGYLVQPSRGEPVACRDAHSLTESLQGRLPRNGVVQQGLELAAVGGRMVDFRVVVQKDGTGDWTVAGTVGRCGEDALFVSNMATGGFPLPAADALALLFGPSPVAIFRHSLELERVALVAARALERGGLRLGDLGLDLAYDRQGWPWVIEANNRDPDHNIGWEAGSWPLFYRFRTRPLEYACHLAGFGGEP